MIRPGHTLCDAVNLHASITAALVQLGVPTADIAVVLARILIERMGNEAPS